MSDASHKAQENQRYVMVGRNPVACGKKLQQLVSWELNSVVGSAGWGRALHRSPSCSQVTSSVRQAMVFSTLRSFWTWLITASVIFPGALLLQEHLWIPLTSSNADPHPSRSDARVTTPARAASEPQPHAQGAACSPPLPSAHIAARDPCLPSSSEVAPEAAEGARGSCLWHGAVPVPVPMRQAAPDGRWERVCVMNPPIRR